MSDNLYVFDKMKPIFNYQSKLHIDINIAFYLYNGSPDRIKITENKFKNLLHLRNTFKDIANFTFTLIGSEKDVSKSLFDKYFDETNATYFEYNQNGITRDSGYHVFTSMLTDKYRFSFNKSFEKNPNISLICGSNDFISYNFFEQIIDFYSPLQKQLFGIDNFINGKNFTNLILFDSNKNEFIDSFLWNGIDHAREQFKYCGGIIGFNDLFYKSNHDVFNNIISFDEGVIEYHSTIMPDTIKFNSNECFYLNIKSNHSCDLTPYELCKSALNVNVTKLEFSDLSEQSKARLEAELKSFLAGY